MTQPETVVPFPSKTDPAKKVSSNEHIWGKAVMSHGYTAVPVIMVRAQSRLGINATQFNILVQLLEYWRTPERRPFPTKKEIAGRIGLTEKTVQVVTHGPARGRTLTDGGLPVLVTTGIDEPALRALYLATVFPAAIPAATLASSPSP